MAKIAPAVLEDIQNQVDATEFIKINEVNQSIKNDIKDQEDSTPPIPNPKRRSEAKAGSKT